MTNLETFDFNMEVEIMRRVRLVYFMRSWVIPSALKMLVFAIFIGLASFFVSFTSVFANIMRVFAGGSVFDYVIGAVLGTEFAVQAILLAMFATIFYFTWTGARKFRWGRARSFLQRA